MLSHKSNFWLKAYTGVIRDCRLHFLDQRLDVFCAGLPVIHDKVGMLHRALCAADTQALHTRNFDQAGSVIVGRIPED